MKRLALSAAIVLALSATAQARRHTGQPDANGNLAVVKTASGLTARVAISAREKFQKFIDAIESRGTFIKDIACYVRGGHMPGSKHYRGLACDIDQQSRNVTSRLMRGVTEIAHQFGLVDGCEWKTNRGERYTGPDCGHVEIPGPTRTYSARRRR